MLSPYRKADRSLEYLRPVGVNVRSEMRRCDPDARCSPVYNEREKSDIVMIYEALRLCGLVPWFWHTDAPPNWHEAEVQSITATTPASAVFLGPNGWGERYHLPFARLAYESGRPTIPVLLPSSARSDLDRFP